MHTLVLKKICTYFNVFCFSIHK